MKPIVIKHMAKPSDVYGFKAIRDRHLDSATVYKVCSHPAIIEKCASLLGPDLLIWRTNFFRKKPGEDAIMWHRGTNFAGVRNLPAIVPAENVTCWIALTDATIANGCVQLIPGSHKREYGKTEADGTRGVFGRGKVMTGLNTEDAVHMEVKAGQFFLFNEKTVHGSDPNESDTERTGIAVRVVSNEVKVYPGQKVDGAGVHLNKWHAILVRGEDKLGHNKIGPPPTSDEYAFGPMKQLMGKLRFQYQKYVYGLGYHR